MRKIISILLAFNIALLPEISFAQKKPSSKQRKANGRSLSQAKKKSSSTKTSEKSDKKQTEENTSENSTLTCEEKYDLCMDNVCVNELGVRSDCDSSIDSFETVNKDGEKFRVGSDLYTFARGVCSDTLKSCELKERNHIETTYKAKIIEDSLTKNYLEAVNSASDETQEAVLKEYMECMAPLCGANFSNCFTIKNVERRASNCQNVLAKTSKPLTVKGMFYKKLQEERENICKNSGGYVDYDSKICTVDVTYGSLEKLKDEEGKFYYSGKMTKFVAKKMFKVGEIVECTQEYFNAMNTDKPFLARGLKDIAMGAVKSVAGVALVVAGAVATVGTVGLASANSTPMIANGASLICKGSATTLNGVVKINTDVRVESGCFINGKAVSLMGQYFKVNFKFD